jgi:hypothetical protein
MAYMTSEFERLGLQVEHYRYVLPEDSRPTDFAAGYRTASGTTIELTTAFPVAGTKATRRRGITAEAVWVGVGSGADFIGRDIRGKAVVIYSTFVPGGRSHSASGPLGRRCFIADPTFRRRSALRCLLRAARRQVRDLAWFPHASRAVRRDPSAAFTGSALQQRQPNGPRRSTRRPHGDDDVLAALDRVEG